MPKPEPVKGVLLDKTEGPKEEVRDKVRTQCYYGECEEQAGEHSVFCTKHLKMVKRRNEKILARRTIKNIKRELMSVQKNI